MNVCEAGNKPHVAQFPTCPAQSFPRKSFGIKKPFLYIFSKIIITINEKTQRYNREAFMLVKMRPGP